MQLPGSFESFESAFLAETAQNEAFKNIDWKSFEEKIRKAEYSRLDEAGHAYLDYTGSNLYPKKLVDGHHAQLLQDVLGNPHSINPTANASTTLMEDARVRVLDFFKAPHDEYYCIFTSNASSALKIVGEAYPFGKDGVYAYTSDNHNSVLGIRQFAIDKKSACCVVGTDKINYRINHGEVDNLIDNYRSSKNKLFAFPAQSNSTGVKHSLDIIEKLKSNGWDVLLDAAAFVPANPLDLSVVKPDYVCISFYKIFGYPTGIGCLLVSKKANAPGEPSPFSKLRDNKPTFAGGNVDYVNAEPKCISNAPGAQEQRLVNAVFYDDHRCFEDGTVNFLGIPRVVDGLDYITNDITYPALQQRVYCLMNYLVQTLTGLRYTNQQPFARICGYNSEKFENSSTILIKFFKPDGNQYWGKTIEDVLTAYNEQNHYKISVRIGTFCNPGINETCSDDGLNDKQKLYMRKRGDAPITFSDSGEEEMWLRNAKGYMPGGVRVSFGIASNYRDLYEFLKFAEHLFKMGT